MQALYVGQKGKDVKRWQNFLIGRGLLKDVADGVFGPNTDAATKKFQKAEGLTADGVVGNRTIQAAMRHNFSLVDDTPAAAGAAGPQPPPPSFGPLSSAARSRLFGTIAHEPAPTASNKEAIRITNGWAAQNIVSIVVPQLAGIAGASKTGKLSFHRKAADQMLGLWSEWERRGLLPLVKTYGGSWVPRYIRGSRTTLSAHAWGTAFDINVAWNGLGAVPAARGTHGSVRELVPIANDFGFYWGGHFSSRPDGMHFEVARLL